ncbi:MAG: glycosyltransferase family 9 protein [Bryobacteraceae bacterium]
MTLLEQLPEGSRVAIIRLRSLGDCVLTTPGLGLLKQTRPDLSVGVAVEDRFRAVFAGNPAIQAVLDPSWQAVRSWRSTLCVNLHGGSRSQWMTALSGAKWRAGFSHHSFTFSYNVKIPRAQRILGVSRTVHTAEHMASAFFALGVPMQPIPRAALYPSDVEAIAAAKGALDGQYAVLHPFASEPLKQWPADRFCEVARYLELWQVRPIFLAGPDDDASAFERHLVWRGDLESAKVLLSRASFFIGNDSGPAHMAAAFGRPTVVLFGNSNPAIWSPWRTESEVIVAPDGLNTVNVSRVIAALERLRVFEKAHA